MYTNVLARIGALRQVCLVGLSHCPSGVHSSAQSPALDEMSLQVDGGNHKYVGNTAVLPGNEAKVCFIKSWCPHMTGMHTERSRHLNRVIVESIQSAIHLISGELASVMTTETTLDM